MLYELYLQLQCRADKRQIKDPKLGLAHNMGNESGMYCPKLCFYFQF
jgi:acetyl-CoA C-acetyltransferase